MSELVGAIGGTGGREPLERTAELRSDCHTDTVCHVTRDQFGPKVVGGRTSRPIPARLGR